MTVEKTRIRKTQRRLIILSPRTYIGFCVKTIDDSFLKDSLTTETKEEIEKNRQKEQKINRDDLIYKTGNKNKSKTYDFEMLETIMSCRRYIYSRVITQNDAFEDQ